MLSSFKKYLIGFIIGISFVGSISYAANTGSIGSLFNYLSVGSENGLSIIGSIWRLDGTKILDETITSYEIQDGTITGDDLKDSYVNSTGGIVTGDLTIIDNLGVGKNLAVNGNAIIKGKLLVNGKEVLTEDYFDLYSGSNTIFDCMNLGGKFLEVDGGLKICKIPGNKCPSGWSKYKNYSTAGSCALWARKGRCGGAGCYISGSECRNNGRSFSDSTRVYTCDVRKVGTCRTPITEVGCY
ncbi:hypothetical protein A9Q91_02370 [Candidatus Gracilibacteria bacterium 28_42_T64]|nr:hypothetical protein A9Q91_02370 [Candidatus Gracilibacteria bacterium 28_42_T64]